MARTRTGKFPIGFRNNPPHWPDGLGAARFAAANGFEVIDVAFTDAERIQAIIDLGVGIGTVDLDQPWTDLSSADASKRSEAADRNAATIRRLVAMGVKTFFAVILPEDFGAEPKTNLERAADGFGRLCAQVEDIGARIVLEGWPGPAPHFPALACTPESCRAVFEAVGSPVLGANYDPSHLIRIGVDPLRFLDEFIDRVYHVHAKDTEIFTDALHDCGNLQPAATSEPHDFGGHHWRYTIPGHGIAPWVRIARRLEAAGFDGVMSVELEDENFTGEPANWEAGLVASRDYLIHV